ncbi:MAG: hypothetical protein WDO15_20540 [Bacteroidota bacterium]
MDAESASDIRGLRVSQNGGATITNYDANGNEVTLSLPGKNGPQGCSFSGQQFPATDSPPLEDRKDCYRLRKRRNI